MREKVLTQHSDVLRPALTVAHRVEEQRRGVEYPELPQEPVPEGDDLDVDIRVVQADGLDPELPVLPVPALLWALVAEQRREVPDLPWPVLLVLDVGAHDRRRALGSEREPPAAPVRELVHLLADDIGRRAEPVEDLGVLEHRGDDQLVAEPSGTIRERAHELQPARRLRGDDVVSALRRAVGVGSVVSRHRGIVPAASRRAVERYERALPGSTRYASYTESMRFAAPRIDSRWLGSASSKSNRSFATRSLDVCDVQARMLT